MEARFAVIFLLALFGATHQAEVSDIYEVLAPENCVGEECQIQILVWPTEDGQQIQLVTNSNFDYVSVGFSADEKMGDEVTVDCIKQSDNKVQVLPASNKATQHEVEKKESESISVLDSKVNATQTWCTFEFKEPLTVSTFSVEDETSYYLLGAAGAVKDGVPQRHTVKVVSKDKVKISIPSSATTVQATLFIVFMTLFSQFDLKIIS